jgi:hypothetical protein
MNTGVLILIIVLALGALGGVGYGIWYAVSSGGGPSYSPIVRGPSFAVPPFGPMSSSPQQQPPPADFAKTSR